MQVLKYFRWVVEAIEMFGDLFALTRVRQYGTPIGGAAGIPFPMAHAIASELGEGVCISI